VKHKSVKKQKIWKLSPKNIIYRGKVGCVVCSDALELLNSLKEQSVDVVFLDPPFNLGKQYARKKRVHDKMNDDDYYGFITNVLNKASDVLKDGGSLFLYHLPKWGYKFANFLDGKLFFQHWIAISMKNGFVRGPRLYPAHYVLLHFSKGTPKVLKRPKIPIQICRHCGEDIKDYGGYRKYLDKGLNLSDVWDDVSPVRHRHMKYRKQNELPRVIIERILKMSGKKNGLFLDPFAGAGTAPVAAKEFGMKIVASDREKVYCNLITKRLGLRPTKGG
jgi:site-specific DNA-methyltransferase (adenine-specific)